MLMINTRPSVRPRL